MRHLTLLLLAVTFAASIFSQEDELRPVGLDAGAFVSYGYFEPESDNIIDTITNIANTIGSIRGGVTVTCRYRMTSLLSAGIEGGIGVLNIEYDGNTYEYYDFPINAVVRLGGKSTFIEAHGGYYYSDLIYSGISAGGKVSFGGAYLDGTYIWGNELVYPRFTLGFQLNNIL